ncbi:Uncharacterized protein GBIM_06959 [Gryllus bimaculatus]|nr:Uncharacterized protein GBIM_06959 [Gryllus bimaculatus]
MAPSPKEDNISKLEPDDDGSWIDEQLLQQVLDEKAIIVNIDVKRATGKGDNYLSLIYRTYVEYRLPESDDVHSKDLVVKGFPPGEFMQNYIDETGVFKREISIYNDVLPKLYAFADSRLGSGLFKKFSPAFYETSREDILILEDLKPQGFVMASRKNRLDYPHAKLIIQNLARFHALSFVYSECYPEFLSDFVDSLFGEMNRKRLEMFMPSLLKGITDTVRKWEGFGEIASKLDRLLDTFVDRIINVNNPTDAFVNVLIHGDCWVNNILFNYSEAGVPKDMRFVDFQIARKTSPAIELQYFLFTSLRNQVRIDHFEDLLREYCEVFATYAKKLGYTGTVFTYEDLQKEINRTLFFGLSSAMTTMAAVLAEPEDTPDMENITEEEMTNGDQVDTFVKMYESPLFRDAFENLLPYFDKQGVLD